MEYIDLIYQNQQNTLGDEEDLWSTNHSVQALLLGLNLSSASNSARSSMRLSGFVGIASIDSGSVGTSQHKSGTPIVPEYLSIHQCWFMVSEGVVWLDGRLRSRPNRRACLSGSSGIVGRVMVDSAALRGLRSGISWWLLRRVSVWCLVKIGHCNRSYFKGIVLVVLTLCPKKWHVKVCYFREKAWQIGMVELWLRYLRRKIHKLGSILTRVLWSSIYLLSQMYWV